MELKVEGRRPVGRPKMTWSKVVEEDMTKIVEATHIASNPRNEKLRTLNEDDDEDFFLLHCVHSHEKYFPSSLPRCKRTITTDNN